VRTKSPLGLRTRLETKILGFKLVIIINQLLGKENIAKIKELVIID